MTVPWRVVRCLTTLRLQVNAAYPGRATGADGTIGDAAHMAESNSDHDPHYYSALGSTAVVCALDITHDPAHGCDTYAMAEAMRQARDPRVGYIISNRRITGPNHGWKWDVYTGTSDPHTGHVHVSSVHTALADSETPWRFTPTAVVTSVVTPNPIPAAPDLEDSMPLLYAYAGDGGPTSRWFVCANGWSIEVSKARESDFRTLRDEGSMAFTVYTAGPNKGKSSLDFPRSGWTESFGKLVPLNAAPATVTLSPDQLATITAAIVAHPDNPLGDADKPAIEQAVAAAFAKAFPAAA